VALAGMQVIATLDSTYSIGLPESWFEWVRQLGLERFYTGGRLTEARIPVAADENAQVLWRP
jgi:hypothetical protein